MTKTPQQIWEGLSSVAQRALLRTGDTFGPTPEVNSRKATASMRALRDADLVEDGFGWRRTAKGRAVADYGRPLYNAQRPKPPRPTWTQTWPTEEGWYWTWMPAEPRRPDPRPTEVRYAGSEPRKFWAYIRDGAFMFPEEHKDKVIWWLRMKPPELPTT